MASDMVLARPANSLPGNTQEAQFKFGHWAVSGAIPVIFWERKAFSCIGASCATSAQNRLNPSRCHCKRWPFQQGLVGMLACSTHPPGHLSHDWGLNLLSKPQYMNGSNILLLLRFYECRRKLLSFFPQQSYERSQEEGSEISAFPFSSSAMSITFADTRFNRQ